MFALPRVEMEGRQIQRLNTEIQGHLRSGVAVATVAQCVEELVLNAVDAMATCVAVRVSLDVGRIQVVDNGCGIRREDLSMLGERYIGGCILFQLEFYSENSDWILLVYAVHLQQ